MRVFGSFLLVFCFWLRASWCVVCLVFPRWFVILELNCVRLSDSFNFLLLWLGCLVAGWCGWALDVFRVGYLVLSLVWFLTCLRS